jgi:translation initiation factor 2 beta subunit (eIF-2beta)/eIF-5
MSNNRDLQKLVDALLAEAIKTAHIEPYKDFSVLQNFTDEELANELSRRTDLGKELE